MIAPADSQIQGQLAGACSAAADCIRGFARVQASLGALLVKQCAKAESAADLPLPERLAVIADLSEILAAYLSVLEARGAVAGIVQSLCMAAAEMSPRPEA